MAETEIKDGEWMVKKNFYTIFGQKIRRFHYEEPRRMEGRKMNKKTGKRIRHGRMAGMLFILGTLALVGYGSFAAYTSFNSVRRVVSTGTQRDTMFSSNYLSLLNLNDMTYQTKRISFSGEEETCVFKVFVCNYVWGDESLYNPKNITYTVTVRAVMLDGESVKNYSGIKLNGKEPDDSGEWTLKDQILKSGKANSGQYKFELPADLKNKVKIQMIAEPSDESSKETVNNQKLAAIFSFADYEVTKSWSGHFLDSKTNRTPKDYDAFNYEISGNGAGTVKVTWKEGLQLSKWAKGTLGTGNTYEFKVDDSTTAIQFQFYRDPENPLADKISWEDLEKLVTVTFTEDAET